MTSPSDCDRFDMCGAPICPMDDDWKHRVMLDDEPICFYIRKLVRGNIGGAYPELWPIARVTPILDTFPRMRHHLCDSRGTKRTII